MRRLSEKLLAVLFALLMGLAPSQGAMAGFSSSCDQVWGMHQMPDQHDGGLVMAADHAAAQDCEQCNTDTGCNGQNCSSSHNISRALELLPVFSLPTYPTVASVFFRADDGYISQLSSSLFRPPRA